MSIQHITELFALDGREFVTEAYRNLLNREPDVHGMAYYLGRLAQGRGKAAVIAQLAKSPECKPHDEIKGLKRLIKDERHAKHWFWGSFANRNLIGNTQQGIIFWFERLVERERVFTEQLMQVQSKLSSLHDDAFARLSRVQQDRDGLAALAAQRESELSVLHQAKGVLEQENEEILHNFLALQEEMEVLILERRENENRLNKLDQQKNLLEEENASLLREQDALHAQQTILQQERDEQAWYAAERLAWLNNLNIQAK